MINKQENVVFGIVKTFFENGDVLIQFKQSLTYFNYLYLVLPNGQKVDVEYFNPKEKIPGEIYSWTLKDKRQVVVSVFKDKASDLLPLYLGRKMRFEF